MVGILLGFHYVVVAEKSVMDLSQVAAGVQCRRFSFGELPSLNGRYIEALIEGEYKGVFFEVLFSEFFHGEKFPPF